MCSSIHNTVLYSECAKCRSEHDGAIILTFRQLLYIHNIIHETKRKGKVFEYTTQHCGY